MINHKIFTKCQSRSSLLASVALLLGGALSLSSAVQAQETTISLGIGSQLGSNDTSGPSHRSITSSTSNFLLDYMAPNSTIFTVAVHTENGGANNEFHFTYLYGKDELKSDPNAPAWSSYPRSYIEPSAPFRYDSGGVFFDNAKKVTSVETGLHFEYRSYYSTELLSRGGVTFSAYGGFGISTTYFNINNVYETSSGSTFAETNQTEFAVRATPIVGTTVQYGFANGHYLKSKLNVLEGTGIGYVSIQNDIVKNGNGSLAETFENRTYADRAGLDASLASQNTTVAVVYGTDLFEFTAGSRSFRAAHNQKTHTYFEVGFKF